MRKNSAASSRSSAETRARPRRPRKPSAKHAIGSDLEKVGRHIITREEYEETPEQHPDWLKPVGEHSPPHTDLEKLDAHVISREEYEEDPEATDEEIASADLYHGARLVRRGRPLKADRKVPMTIRLRPETLAHFKAKGPGWQQQIQDILNAVVSFETDQAEREAKAAADAVPAKKPARRKGTAAGARGTRIQRYHG